MRLGLLKQQLYGFCKLLFHGLFNSNNILLFKWCFIIYSLSRIEVCVFFVNWQIPNCKDLLLKWKYERKLTIFFYVLWPIIGNLSNVQQVKIWCTNQEASVLNIDMKANICSVKYNPGSSIHIVVSPCVFWSCSVTTTLTRHIKSV